MILAFIRSFLTLGAVLGRARPHVGRQRLSGWLLIGLLWLMPLQFSWATVARYCQHESVVQAEQRHAGHHSHEHQSVSVAPAESDGAPSALPDGDCHYCHASVAPFVISQYAQQLPSLTPQQQTQALNAFFAEWIPPSIERPKWHSLRRAGMAKGVVLY